MATHREGPSCSARWMAWPSGSVAPASCPSGPRLDAPLPRLRSPLSWPQSWAAWPPSRPLEDRRRDHRGLDDHKHSHPLLLVKKIFSYSCSIKIFLFFFTYKNHTSIFYESESGNRVFLKIGRQRKKRSKRDVCWAVVHNASILTPKVYSDICYFTHIVVKESKNLKTCENVGQTLRWLCVVTYRSWVSPALFWPEHWALCLGRSPGHTLPSR